MSNFIKFAVVTVIVVILCTVFAVAKRKSIAISSVFSELGIRCEDTCLVVYVKEDCNVCSRELDFVQDKVTCYNHVYLIVYASEREQINDSQFCFSADYTVLCDSDLNIATKLCIDETPTFFKVYGNKVERCQGFTNINAIMCKE